MNEALVAQVAVLCSAFEENELLAKTDIAGFVLGYRCV